MYVRGMQGLGALDWTVMAVYGAAVLAIGWFANRRQTSTEDYHLGGRRLRWWAVGVSLVATSFSSVSLVGGTAFGYAQGMRWLQLQLGDLLAIGLVCAVFLPFFSGLGLTTAYEYLERRFGVVARTVASALFLVQTLLRASILVLAPAVVLATVTGWSVDAAILVSAGAAIVYSAFGGIAAVVWTDLIQMVVVVGAVAACLVLATGDVPGGASAVLDHARGSGRLEWLTWSTARDTPFNVLGSFVPYGVLALSLFGTGQQAVQRYLACGDIGSARRAAFTGWAVGTLALGLTLFFGVTIAAWAELAHGAEFAAAGDDVLPAFLLARVPAGLAGLLVAAVFAASMSSLDSAIHSMSTAVSIDFVRRFSSRPLAARTELVVARTVTAVVGVLATGGALLAARWGSGLLETLVTWLGYFAGPLLGLFLLGMLTRRVRERAALLGVAAAIAVTVDLLVFVGPQPWGFHPLWLAPLSFAVTMTVGWIASAGGPAPDPPGGSAAPPRER